MMMRANGRRPQIKFLDIDKKTTEAGKGKNSAFIQKNLDTNSCRRDIADWKFLYLQLLQQAPITVKQEIAKTDTAQQRNSSWWK